MEISANMVKELRESTGAGMMDCKKALVEAKGDMQKAVDILREKGLSKAAKKSDRLASEGIISVKVCDECKKASIVEINSETDFVAKNENFLNLAEKTTNLIGQKNIKSTDELMKAEIDGISYEEYLKNQIALIGENLVVRRMQNVEICENGVVNGYLHSNTKVGVIIAAKCEKPEVAKKAKEFIKNLCMHAAAMRPSVISYQELELDFVEKELTALRAELEKENEELKRLGKPLNHIPKFASQKQITQEVKNAAIEEIKAELAKEGKPEKIWDKILPGKLERFMADNTILDQRLTLLGQFFVMDDKKTIAKVLEEKSQEFGGKIEIIKYVRFEVGEGLEKKTEDFAAQVAAQIG